MRLKPLLLLVLLCAATYTKAQNTKIQFINNCADVSHTSLDIYIDGILVFNDLQFRNATTFLDVNFFSATNIGIAEQNSIGVIDTFLNLNIALSPSNTYIMTINGIRSTSGYSPMPKVSLDVYNQAHTATSVGQTKVLFINGATDAPIMDMRTGISTLVNDAAYRSYSNYADLMTNKVHTLRLTNTKGNKTSHTYLADFVNLNTDGEAVTILTSGFINPAANSGGEEFGLWLVRPGGGGFIPLDTATEAEAIGRVQFIHNSADTAISKVDVYMNGEKTLDAFPFRSATPYMDAYAKLPTSVVITKAGSTTDTVYKTAGLLLDSASSNLAILYGISDSSKNYSPQIPLDLKLYKFAKEEAPTATTASLIFMQGSTDCPTPDVSTGISGSAPTSYSNNMTYGQITNYLNGASSPGTGKNYLIKIDTGASNKLMHNYILPYDNWNLGGKTVTILFSGFNDTAKNSDGVRVGLWAAPAEGGALLQLPIEPPVGINDVVWHANKINVSPNPATNELSFNLANEIKDIIITDISGKIAYKTNGDGAGKVNISKLNTGLYIILLHAENGEVFYSKFNKL